MSQSASSDSTEYNKLLDSLESISRTLDNIDSKLHEVATNQGFRSQSAARDSKDQQDNTRPFGQHHANFQREFNKKDYKDDDSAEKNQRRSPFNEVSERKLSRSFSDRLEKSILDALGGDTLRKGWDKFIKEFSKGISRSANDEDVLEKSQDVLTKTIANTLKNTGLGKSIKGKIGDLTKNLFGDVSGDEIAKGLNSLFKDLSSNPDADLGALFEGLKGIDLGPLGNSIASGGSELVGTFTELTATVGSSVATLGVGLVVLAAVEAMVKRVEKGLHQASEGLEEFKQSVVQAEERYSSSRIKNIELANERLRADVQTLVEEPFNILKKAADEVYSAWSANARLIGGTQGYRKEDLQDLMSAFARRLESEGLSRVVSSTDIYNNLAKVIESGLTGGAAVEFAYQATRLNAAVPNQDFFGYVESYASVAANAIAAGKSEAEALQIANNSLEEFSNSLLYASRDLTGGYGTSLKSAQTTYEAAVKISQAAKSSNINTIASSLLAIQGYVGSIAPDLANSLTEKIYQLAVGGNAEDIVALRSLAGINASNTEFLRAFANDPQSILSNMFANLGKMFTQSSDAYMEKAEAYASLFGISAEALQRVDFQSLATAIKQMNANSNALDQNIKLLREGETTTTADQLKIQQINQYMIEEGLAYVIDNEAAQMIQEHMWNEQMKRELMEAEYGVNIVGGVASAIEKIKQGIETIINIMNPFAWLGNASDLVKSVQDSNDIQADIKSVLEAGVVGKGSKSDLYNLTTRNKKLDLTPSLLELLGGMSKYSNSEYEKGGLLQRIANAVIHPVTGGSDLISDAVSGVLHAVYTKEGRQSLKDAASSLWSAGTDFWTGDLKGEFSELKNTWRSLTNAFTTSAGYTEIYKSKNKITLPSSQYSWSSASKSSAALSSALLSQTTGEVSGGIVSNVLNAISSSVSVVKDKISKWLSGDTLAENYIKKGKSYEEWRKDLASQGVEDVDEALKSAGYKPEDVESYYEAKRAELGMQEKAEDRAEQKAFWKVGTNFLDLRFWEEFSSPTKTALSNVESKIDSMLVLQTSWQESQIHYLQSIVKNQVDWKDYFDTTWLAESWKNEFVGESGLFTKFFNEFVNKFVEHTYYDASGYKYSDVTDIQRREDAEKGSAVYALADALTGNLVDLKDPQVQTNAILAQILVVVSAIMNQNNNVASTVSLSDALSGLALGLTSSTPFSETPVTM